MQKQCVSCGNTFSKSKTKSLNVWEKRKFCSLKCSNTKIPWNKGIEYDEQMKARMVLTGLEAGHGWSKGMKFPEWSGENSPSWLPKTSKPCKGCSKIISLAPWEKKRLFCSMDCYGLWHRGKNSPVFVGNKNKKNLRCRIMELPEHVAWRQAIFHRDNFTCLLCSKRGGDLDADHFPESYAALRDRMGFKTAQEARECPGLWNIENGRTLCRECHRKTDNYLKKTKLASGVSHGLPQAKSQ